MGVDGREELRPGGYPSYGLLTGSVKSGREEQVECLEVNERNDNRSRLRGILLCTFASLSYSTSVLFVRIGTSMGLSVGLHVLVRGIITIALSGTVIRLSHADLPSRDVALLVIVRGLIGSSNMLLVFVAVSLLPLTLATAIMFTSPAITIVLSRIFLGESLEVFTISACLLSCTGFTMVTIDRESIASSAARRSDKLVGIIVSCVSALLTSLELIVSRWIGSRTKVHPQWNVFSVGLFSLVLGAILMAANEAMSSELSLVFSSIRYPLVLVMAGLGAYGGASCVNWALQLIEAGIGGVLRTLEFPFSAILGLLVLGESPSPQGIMGSALILVASMALGYWRART